MFDWNNKLSKLLKLYFVKRWRSSFFHNSHIYQNCQTVLFDWFSKFQTDQDFKVSIVWQLKNHSWWRQNECKQRLKLHQWGCCGYLCWCTYKRFLLLGWENDPLGCLLILLVALVASLGKACHFLKICSKRNKFKVDGLLAYVHMACWLNWLQLYFDESLLDCEWNLTHAWLLFIQCDFPSVALLFLCHYCECKMNQLKVLIMKVFSFLSDKFIYHIWSLQGEGPITLLQRAHQNTGNLMTTVQFLIVIFIIIFSKYFSIFDWLKYPS